MDSNVKRGDIFYADLSPVVGSEQGGTRPVLIVQNDTGNRHSPTVIAAAITSQNDIVKIVSQTQRCLGSHVYTGSSRHVVEYDRKWRGLSNGSVVLVNALLRWLVVVGYDRQYSIEAIEVVHVEMFYYTASIVATHTQNKWNATFCMFHYKAFDFIFFPFR